MFHKTLLNLVILFVTTSCWSQEETTYKGWKFGAHFSPEYGYRTLSGDTSVMIVNYTINQRNDWERPIFLYTAKLSASYRIGKRFAFQSGLQYSVRGERSIDLGLGPDYDYSVSGFPIEVFIYRYRYHYLSIPLSASYYFLNKKRFQLFVSTGVGINFLYLFTRRNTLKGYGTPESTEFKSIAIKKDNPTSYNLFNPSIDLSLGLDWIIGKRSSIRFEPTYRRSLREMVDAPIRGIYYNVGINIGYIYSFR